MKGEKVHLRALDPEDEEIIYRWENNPEIWQVSNTLTPISRRTIRDYLAQIHLDIYQSRQLRLVIVRNEPESMPVGLIDLYEYDPYHQRAGVGILIADPADRGLGYAGEALDLLIDYAFNTLLLNQLFSSMLDGNQTSLKLFTGAGFSLSGTKIAWIRTRNGFADELFLQLLKSHWISVKPKSGM